MSNNALLQSGTHCFALARHGTDGHEGGEGGSNRVDAKMLFVACVRLTWS